MELIRPLLPSIRSTPYGKRIHSKIQREQQQHQPQRRIRQHQSLGSLRFNASSNTGPGNSPLYQGPTTPTTIPTDAPFGLPLIGNNDPLYPYP